MGAVSTAASTVFGYGPTLPLSVTAVSALTWFCFHKFAQNFEPQAQSMLRHFKDLERERKSNPPNKENVVCLSPQEFLEIKEKISLASLANTLRKRKENSRSLAEELKKTLEIRLKSNNSTQKLIQLFDVLLVDNIKKLIINEDQIEVQLYKSTTKRINSQSTILNIPQKIVFQIKDGIIIFDETYAPYEDQTGGTFFKSTFFW